MWTDWADAQADLSSLGAHHFVGFVMLQLIVINAPGHCNLVVLYLRYLRQNLGFDVLKPILMSFGLKIVRAFIRGSTYIHFSQGFYPFCVGHVFFLSQLIK